MHASSRSIIIKLKDPSVVFDRPGVAGAVLQTVVELIGGGSVINGATPSSYIE